MESTEQDGAVKELFSITQMPLLYHFTEAFMLKIPRALLSVFPLLLLACGGTQSVTAPPVLDLASVSFKMDAVSCTITRQAVLSIDGGQISTQVLAPGAVSPVFGTTASKHVLSAKAIGAGAPFTWVPQTVTLTKDQSYQALLTC